MLKGLRVNEKNLVLITKTRCHQFNIEIHIEIKKAVWGPLDINRLGQIFACSFVGL
jgi:hypothetical protein